MPLTGKVAVVTGASRGVGKGIAQELGAAGANVVVTGRTMSGKASDGAPGSIEETAQLVTKAGGRGIAAECDHTDDKQVAALVKRITGELGQVDILVNNVWGGYEAYKASDFQQPLPEQPLERLDKMWRSGPRAHYLMTRALAPRIASGGLVCFTSAWDRGIFLGDVQYDMAKAAVVRLAYDVSCVLRPRDITSVAVIPGFTRTERVEMVSKPDQLGGTHSPRYVGRAVVALATDAKRLQQTGKTLKVGDLAKQYKFTDLDGSQPAGWEFPKDWPHPAPPT